MKAVGLYKYLPIENQESLVDLDIERPTPTSRDILVKVKAIAVNPVDTKVRKPKEKVESEPQILGWDVAGIVEEIGPDCTLFQPGDEVFYAGSITRQGGNSEFHLVDERIVGKKPASLDFADAAALPLTSITAWESLFERLGINIDDSNNQKKSILIIGAAGGVGSIATQLAKLANLTVIGTASRPESVKWAKEHGADFVINHFESFVPQLKEIGHEHVDYILCLNTTEKHWNNMAEAIAPQGKICSIEETDELIDITLLKNKSVTFVWELMFTRSMFQTDDMIEQHHLLNKVSESIDQKRIKTTVREVLSPINAENLRKAHATLEAGRTIGKIVLKDF
ncbi:zinc-binding alcohol dehydrogenase family protein [Halalkalibacter nanhaiisediminis]|uniref:Zinc-type alcohol dehydrogenase-like protein n=1 Tax=Halalkalibacter nanhaiisediminis TaxID=688079 RepID=A0A562QQQ6_9BACI|nr:zinc-binding alcohol dehydrogenase family protein [Halalkalibacter nanhaiisediminis]TWI59088.1 zinc-binding alcohol dehydrogenase family protein [Halalkalibacter nanhaiisediminis]